MNDNEVADKNIAHNEVINDKSIDDKMADEKINDNKTTEEITAEEKIEETSKDDEMTDAQHSDGESAEDEIVSLSAIRQLLFPDMPDLFFNAISKENLGLPSQFHWPSAYEWLRKVTVKFHSKGENACKDTEGKKSLLTLQFACIRFRCVACRRPYQDAETMAPIQGHSGLLFPCGHVIGDSCHDALVDNFKSFEMSPICP